MAPLTHIVFAAIDLGLFDARFINGVNYGSIMD
jgi:hypothetical protein